MRTGATDLSHQRHRIVRQSCDGLASSSFPPSFPLTSSLPRSPSPTHRRVTTIPWIGRRRRALRSALHEIVDDHIRFPYTSGNTDTWNILELADEDPNNPSNILDVYKNASYPKQGGGVGSFNREHSWPNSYGFPDDGASNYPYTDCHALFLSDSSYNSSRGNNPYRFCPACTERATDVNNGQGGGTGVYPGNSNWRTGSGSTGTWETWIGRRGDVARALFYLDVRYAGGFHGVTGVAQPDLILTDDQSLIVTSGGVNASVAYMGMRSALLEWHRQDPVDVVERTGTIRSRASRETAIPSLTGRSSWAARWRAIAGAFTRWTRAGLWTPGTLMDPMVDRS